MDMNTVYSEMEKRAGILGSAWNFWKENNPYAQMRRAVGNGLEGLYVTGHNMKQVPRVLFGKKPNIIFTEQDRKIWNALKSLFQRATRGFKTSESVAEPPTDAEVPEVKTASEKSDAVMLLLGSMMKYAALGTGSDMLAAAMNPATKVPPVAGDQAQVKTTAAQPQATQNAQQPAANALPQDAQGQQPNQVAQQNEALISSFNKMMNTINSSNKTVAAAPAQPQNTAVQAAPAKQSQQTGASPLSSLKSPNYLDAIKLNNQR